MSVTRPHRKQIKHYHEPGDFHELTFSCYRPDSTAFRFWQEGPGYDRNLQTERAVTASIDYIHANPVRRKLVKSITQWKWSSARWYVSDGGDADPDLPTIHGPPPELFAPTW